MTSNQIALRQAIETERANRAKESETYRSNVAKEQETNRSNLAQEAETYRKNVANEDLTRETNASKISSPWGLASLFGERLVYGTDRGTGSNVAKGKDENVIYPNDVYNEAVGDTGIKGFWDKFKSGFSNSKSSKDDNAILVNNPGRKRGKYYGKQWA